MAENNVTGLHRGTFFFSMDSLIKSVRNCPPKEAVDKIPRTKFGQRGYLQRPRNFVHLSEPIGGFSQLEKCLAG